MKALVWALCLLPWAMAMETSTHNADDAQTLESSEERLRKSTSYLSLLISDPDAFPDILEPRSVLGGFCDSSQSTWIAVVKAALSVSTGLCLGVLMITGLAQCELSPIVLVMGGLTAIASFIEMLFNLTRSIGCVRRRNLEEAPQPLNWCLQSLDSAVAIAKFLLLVFAELQAHTECRATPGQDGWNSLFSAAAALTIYLFLSAFYQKCNELV